MIHSTHKHIDCGRNLRNAFCADCVTRVVYKCRQMRAWWRPSPIPLSIHRYRNHANTLLRSQQQTIRPSAQNFAAILTSNTLWKNKIDVDVPCLIAWTNNGRRTSAILTRNFSKISPSTGMCRIICVLLIFQLLLLLPYISPHIATRADWCQCDNWEREKKWSIAIASGDERAVSDRNTHSR